MGEVESVVAQLEARMKRLRSNTSDAASEEFIVRYPAAWHELRRALGAEEANALARAGRDEAMRRLRVKHRWHLARVGRLFDVTGERVRQLTPGGIWGQHLPAITDQDALAAALREAVHCREAWGRKARERGGNLRRDWLAARVCLGDDMNIYHEQLGKFRVLMAHGLGLETREAILAWGREQYYVKERSYAEITAALSSRFVPIGVMCVYRGLESVGFKGHPKGRRHDSRMVRHPELADRDIVQRRTRAWLEADDSG